MKTFNFGVHQAFVQAETPSLAMVLQNRENRVLAQTALAQKFPGKSVVALKCNIPGAAKNNALIQYLCDEGVQAFETAIDSRTLVAKHLISPATGPEAMFVVDTDALNIKALCIALENDHPLGRLYDFDVCVQDASGLLQTVSREAIGAPERRCFICDKQAKQCAKARTHSVDQLQSKILELLETSVKFQDENN